MNKIIIFAGYSKIKYLLKIKQYFRLDGYHFVCVHERKATTEGKQKFLANFDETIDLTTEVGKQRLTELSDSVAAITCTQERDMSVYIQTLRICKKITPSAAEKYTSVINKQYFKEIISKKNSELVPGIYVVNDDLIEELDTLTYPLVIKPTGLAGSTLIRVVRSPEEFRKHIQKSAPEIRRIAKDGYCKEVSIIAEEFITGPQYSVNVYIDQSGRVTQCPLIRVITPIELGVDDTYSALQYNTNEVPNTDMEKLTGAIALIVDTFSLKNTSAHFDCVLTEHGWKFFEVGLRIGGNRQALFEQSHGFDHVINDIKNRLGLPVSLPEQRKTVCIVQTAAKTTGRLTSISYRRHIDTESSSLITEKKMKKIGTPVAPLCQGGGTVTRHLVVGKNHEEVLKIGRQLFNDIELSVS